MRRRTRHQKSSSSSPRGETLDIYRIEAALDRAPSAASVSAAHYEKACLAIVALVEHDASLLDGKSESAGA